MSALELERALGHLPVGENGDALLHVLFERLFSEADLKTAFPLTQVRIRGGAVQFDPGGKLIVKGKASGDEAEKLESNDEPAGTGEVGSYNDDADVSAADD